jgi:uncharacterized membrane protein
MKQTTETRFEPGVELAKWLGGAAAGALLMYMLDPDRGSARRAQSAAAVRGAGTRTTGAVSKVWRGAGAHMGAAAGDVARDVVHSASEALASAKSDGAAGRIGSTLTRVGQAAGSMLDETMSRAKTALGRAGNGADDTRSQARSAIARASEGAADAYEQASRSAGRIGGKVAGAWRDSAEGPDAWKPTLRNSALIGGDLLALTGMMRRSPVGLVLGLAGAALLARGATNQPLRKLAGGLAGGRGLDLGTGLGLNQTIDLEKSIHIDASPEEVYDLFANYENFPRFMSHVVEVRDLGRRRSHWTVKGPGGSAFEWNSVITEQSRPHRLAWRSEPGAEIPQTGSIQLEPHHGGTDVTVRMSYTPPAGALGHGLATLLGADPRSKMDEDLARMKAYVERGADSGNIAGNIRDNARSGAQPHAGNRFLH